MYTFSTKFSHETCHPPVLRATRLLDQVHERIRYKHYSLRTDQAYVQWVRMFVKWHDLLHPRDMG